MEVIGHALRQAFMPKREYESLRGEEKAWRKLRRPLVLCLTATICLTIIVSTIISLNIVFPAKVGNSPFCSDRRLLQTINITSDHDSDLFHGAFYLTDQETADFYWLVVFIPSTIVFLASIVYLVGGMAAAYSAPTRHGCLKVVENNCCASQRGSVRCLSILNGVFAVVFGLFALFLGSSLLTLTNSCAMPLFWCYEVAAWALVILYGGTAFFLRRKAAVILDEGITRGQNLGLEMLDTNPIEVTPEVERRVGEGFKAWMGSSLLSSSDGEDEPESYEEAPHFTNSNMQKV